MAVVVRVRPITWVIGVAGSVVAGALLGYDEDGDLVRWWLAPVFAVMWTGSVLRSRVVVGSDRVRIQRLSGQDEVLRQDVIGVHMGGGKHRPQHVSARGGPLDPGDVRRLELPGLINTQRVAEALGLPLLSWTGDAEVATRPRQLGTPWVGVMAVLLALLAAGMAVWFMAWE